MTWLWIVGYLVGALITGRIVALWSMRDGDNREDAAFMAIMVAILWPPALALGALIGAAYLVGRLLTTPTRRQRQQCEREKAAKLARKFDLPWDDT